MVVTQIAKILQIEESSKKISESLCCEKPKLYSYPNEDPVVDICFQCGEWNWIND